MCVAAPLDHDGDGFTAEKVAGTACGGDHCDDSQARTHPGATEVCGDGIDNDCNGQVDDDCQPPPDACSSAERIALSATTTAVIQSNFMSRASQFDSCGAKGTPDAVITKLRGEIKKVATSEQFKTAMTNIGDEVAYLDAPDFAKFWDADAKRVEQAVQSIGRVQG